MNKNSIYIQLRGTSDGTNINFRTMELQAPLSPGFALPWRVVGKVSLLTAQVLWAASWVQAPEPRRVNVFRGKPSFT
jgi:hypothetical protein